MSAGTSVRSAGRAARPPGAAGRNPRWKLPPYRIDMADCISCLACIRHCPPQFGAIINEGIDVIIVAERCSGCGKCLPPVCPVDCIRVDAGWEDRCV